MRCRICRFEHGVVDGVCGHCELQEKGYISLDAARLALVQVEQKATREAKRLRRDRAHERLRRRRFSERAVRAEEELTRYRNALEEIAASIYDGCGIPKPLSWKAQSTIARIASDAVAFTTTRGDDAA